MIEDRQTAQHLPKGAIFVTVSDMPQLSAIDTTQEAESWTVPFTPSAVAYARATITHALGRLGVSAAVVEDARLVISELMGNALRHARPLPEGVLRVGMAVDESVVRLFVVDGGSTSLPTVLHTSAMSLGGRGLSIVHTLTRDWGVEERGTGNTVFGVLSRA